MKFNDDLKYVFDLLSKRHDRKTELDYEIKLLEKNAVDVYHNNRPSMDICSMVDLHKAWLEQPDKITNERYTYANAENSYHYLMIHLIHNVFDSIADDVVFDEKITLMGFQVLGLMIPFSYKNHKFRLQIPNVTNINTYDDMWNYGCYQIQECMSEYYYGRVGEEYSCEDLKKNIKEILDKYVEKSDE